MTTETALTIELKNLLRLDEGDPTRLASRENSRLEYKESFNWGNRAKYGKILAAFANASGGFIVFWCIGFPTVPRWSKRQEL